MCVQITLIPASPALVIIFHFSFSDDAMDSSESGDSREEDHTGPVKPSRSNIQPSSNLEKARVSSTMRKLQPRNPIEVLSLPPASPQLWLSQQNCLHLSMIDAASSSVTLTPPSDADVSLQAPLLHASAESSDGGGGRGREREGVGFPGKQEWVKQECGGKGGECRGEKENFKVRLVFRGHLLVCLCVCSVFEYLRAVKCLGECQSASG